MKYPLYILILLLCRLPVAGQERPGYINYDMVVANLADYSSMKMQFKADSSRLQDTFKIMLDQYQRYLNYGIPHNVLDSVLKVTISDSLKHMEQRIYDFFDFGKIEMTKKQEELAATLKTKVAKELEIYCRANNISCIVEKDALLYCSECIEYTNEFIEFLKGRK